MKFSDVLAEWEKDSVINRDEIETASLAVPKLHSKYTAYLHSYTRQLKTHKRHKDVLKKECFMYYLGKADPEIYAKKGNFDLHIMKGDVSYFINADDQVQECQKNIDTLENYIYVLNDIIKQIHSMSFTIGNAIKWATFVEGGRI